MQTSRRELLAGAAATGVGVKAASTGGSAVARPARGDAGAASAKPVRGVNLGGWLVLEKWIAPSLFARTSAIDEYTLSAELSPPELRLRLEKHRDTWIVDRDFAWMAAHGIGVVRLPVGYWVAEESPPYLTGWPTVERAFRSAKKHGMKVLLDLHGAPGSQNGFDNSGRAGPVGWPTDPANVSRTLDVLDDLAGRCAGFDNLWGVELLNEPRWDVPLDLLKRFYQDGYARVRKHIPPERAAVVIHDGFRPDSWGDFMTGPSWPNVILDTHLYQCFTLEDRKRDAYAQVARASLDRERLLAAMSRAHRCIVGEWSCALPPTSLSGVQSTDAVMRAFGAAQLLSYGSVDGWFFWTYRTEGGGGWSFRECVEKGWVV